MKELAGLKVLVVDDEPDVRDMVRFELETQGCVVAEASNGAQGLEAALRQPPQLILSDVRMPELDGVKMMVALRERGSRAAVVLMTGFSDTPAWEAYALGAEAFIAKPFRIGTLEQTIRRVLTPVPQRCDAAKASAHELKLDFRSWREATRSIAVGRGGLFVTWAPQGIRRDQLVTLCLKVNDGTTSNFKGVGVVRWVRSTPEPDLPAGVGLEIVSTASADGSPWNSKSDQPRDHASDWCVSYIPRALVSPNDSRQPR